MNEYLIICAYTRYFWDGSDGGGSRSSYEEHEYSKYKTAVEAFAALSIGDGRYLNGGPILTGAALFRVVNGDRDELRHIKSKGDII
jgi:hypothetical protein